MRHLLATLLAFLSLSTLLALTLGDDVDCEDMKDLDV
jgi:hypothetical protein